jgi:hypothetical protein
MLINYLQPGTAILVHQPGTKAETRCRQSSCYHCNHCLARGRWRSVLSLLLERQQDQLLIYSERVEYDNHVWRQYDLLFSRYDDIFVWRVNDFHIVIRHDEQFTVAPVDNV